MSLGNVFCFILFTKFKNIKFFINVIINCRVWIPSIQYVPNVNVK